MKPAWILIFLLTAVNIYRAATQSITTDEAFTYTRSVIVPIPELWKTFDANDHVLHTLLCKVSVRLFGVSEFTLRIPALIGGVLMLIMFLRLTRRLFGDGRFALVVFLLLALNPILLDYCSIARGYGMATALFLLALEQFLVLLDNPKETWRYGVAGVTLALAVAANLTIVLPGLAFVAVFAAVHLGRPLLAGERLRAAERFGYIADQLIVPGAVITIALLLYPLLPAKKENFYVGSTKLEDALLSLAHACFFRPLRLLEDSALQNALTDLWPALANGFPVLLLLCVLILLFRKRDNAYLLLSLGCIAAFLIQVLLHHTVGAPYPERRTGLYWIPLATLLSGMVVYQRGRIICWAANLIAFLCLAQFLMEWNVRYYDEWVFDAGTRDIAVFLKAHPPSEGKLLATGTTFPLNTSLDFYRRLYQIGWLEKPVVHKDSQKRFDLYLLNEDELELVQTQKLTVRLKHTVSKVTLATADATTLAQ